MARKLVGADEINSALDEILLDYAAEAREEVRLAAKEAGKEAVKTLKNKSPLGEGSKKGHYRDGWTMTEEKSRYASGFTIHNKKKPGLAHLLEHGHAKRGGGRVDGKPHISPVEEQAIRDFEAELMERLVE